MSNQLSKIAAARRAVEYVQEGMLVGLGTGSTSEEMVRLLADRHMGIEVVTTSDHIEKMARDLGLRVREGFPDFSVVDLTMDGADEVDPQGRLIKGGGGALLREKLVASASLRLLIMVDESKHVPHLGLTRSLPVEIVPFGWTSICSRVEALGCRANLRLLKDGQPLRTDHGNWIFDCEFGPMDDPGSLEKSLKAICGVVETGLFLDLTSLLVTGREDGTTVIQEFSRKSATG